MVLKSLLSTPKGSKIILKVVPNVPKFCKKERKVALKCYTMYLQGAKQNQNVYNWQAFRHVFECLSKWNLQAEESNCTTVCDWKKSLSGGGLSSKVHVYMGPSDLSKSVT